MPVKLPYQFIEGIETIPSQQLYRNFEELGLAAFSTGDLKVSAVAGDQPGWLLCDGRALATNAFPGLFAALQYRYGGAGTSFNLPNLKGRVVVMTDAAQVEFDVLGEVGGSKAIAVGAVPGHTHGFGHTHGTAAVSVDHAHNVYARDFWTANTEPPNHAHDETGTHINDSIWINSGTQYKNAFSGPGHGRNKTTLGVNASLSHGHSAYHDHPSTNFATQSPWPGNTASHSHGTNSQSTSTTDAGTGGASAAGNMPPYMALNYLIKT